MGVADTYVGAAGLMLTSYMVGAFPTGWLLVRWRRGLDIRSLGTGNIGAANIYRNVGAAMAAVVGPLQFLQGLAPILIARAVHAPTWLTAVVAVVAVAGNCWPLFLKFDGGRGVAVATGSVAGLSLVSLGVLLAFYVVGVLSRRLALFVLLGFIALPFQAYATDAPELAAGFGFILAVIALRRLGRVSRDIRGDRRGFDVVWRRLLHDERPGRPLVGPPGR